MHKLLVGVDGSENSMRAVDYAIKFVKENGQASVHLVTAHEEPLVYGEIAVYFTREKFEELQQQASEVRLAEAEKRLKSAGVPYTREILVGPVAPMIAKRAGELGCDNIVIGTRGMTSIGDLLMGSVATKIIHFAHVPITLVK